MVDRDEDQKGIRSGHQVRELGGWVDVVVAWSWWRLKPGVWCMYDWCLARLLNMLEMCTHLAGCRYFGYFRSFMNHEYSHGEGVELPIRVNAVNTRPVFSDL